MPTFTCACGNKFEAKMKEGRKKVYCPVCKQGLKATPEMVMPAVKKDVVALVSSALKPKPGSDQVVYYDLEALASEEFDGYVKDPETQQDLLGSLSDAEALRKHVLEICRRVARRMGLE